MSRFKIISKDSQSVRYEGAPQYNGAYLGVDYIEFRSISSSKIIEWEIGDYVDYFRTGKRYKLYSLPMPKKVARIGSYGAAIEYSNVQFFAATKDLEIAPFKDLVANDNGIHFSTRQDVSTFEDVRGIARRIEACMNDIFPNRWKINVYESDDENLNSLLSEVKEFSVAQGSCLDALSMIYDTWKGVGWIHTTENGQEVITIGRANVRDAGNTTDMFTYGIGNGLTSIKKATANDGEFATRLYIYGSERNLQPRYYNGFNIVSKESVDIRNLMIPISDWGLTNGLPDPKKAYLQADDAIIEKYGLIPKTIYFDGREGEEIYPSIVGITEGKVRKYMIESGLEDSPLLPPDSNDRIDKALSVMFTDDKGSKEDIEANPNFSFWVRGVGFDIAEQGKKTSEGHATISLKSGMCAGREFVVKKSRIVGYSQELTIERTWDESLGMGFPNSLYPIEVGDEFVLLDIPMPDYYISIAEDRLLERGKKMLADYTRVSAFYEPGVNSIRMKEVGGVITPGMFMQISDNDIIDTEDHKDYVLIDSISIDENSDIPTYRITLREQKRAARTYSALEDMIEDAKEEANQAIKRERQYTDRRFRSSQETLKMLESAFSNFSKGITPATVKTMALLIGDKSLQYKFTTSRDSLDEVPCPLVWNPETKQMIGVPASLIHMTLGVESIVPSGTRGASDYKSWNVVSWWDKDAFESPFLEDVDKSYYVYVRASKESTDAWFFIDENAHSMIEDDYYFLVGILNSEYDGSRDFVTLYGFTEVLPGQITTDVIRSADGQTYFDLSKGEIGGKIVFKSNRGEDKSVADLEDEINEQINNVLDTEYLTNVFQKGTAEIEGGVVMSEIVAVRDTKDSKIEAFLNGSDFAEDATHGKLLVAAGIPEGTTALEERAKEAKTKIYEDGTFETVKGEFEGSIKANGGEIGRLKITVNPVTKTTSLSSATDYCSKGFMEIANLTDGNFGASTSYNDTEGVCKQPYNSTIDGVGLHCRRPYKQESLEAFLDDENWERGSADIFIEHENDFDGSEAAFKVNSGVFQGLRPDVRVADFNIELGEYDHTIIIEKPGITVSLPTSPKVGQRYEIFKQYGGSVNIDPQGVQVYSSGSYGGNNGKGTNVTKIGDSAFVRAVYIYTGSYWFRTIENYD